MNSFFILSLAAANILPSLASPMPANPYHLATPVCGPPNSNGNGICVDHNAITSKPFARYTSDSKHYTFDKCTAACHASNQCKSIAYYNTNTFDDFQWVCELLSDPITPYAIKCGDPTYGEGATPFAQNNSRIGQVSNPASLNTSALSNYYEESCTPNTPVKENSGEILSADSDQLICGVWTTMMQSYVDLFVPSVNRTPLECRDACEKTSGCKSYWSFVLTSEQSFGQQQASNGQTNGDCAFFSQPVREHGVFSENPLPMFDINCNPGNGTF